MRLTPSHDASIYIVAALATGRGRVFTCVSKLLMSLSMQRMLFADIHCLRFKNDLKFNRLDELKTGWHEALVQVPGRKTVLNLEKGDA